MNDEEELPKGHKEQSKVINGAMNTAAQNLRVVMLTILTSQQIPLPDRKKVIDLLWEELRKEVDDNVLPLSKKVNDIFWRMSIGAITNKEAQEELAKVLEGTAYGFQVMTGDGTSIMHVGELQKGE